MIKKLLIVPMTCAMVLGIGVLPAHAAPAVPVVVSPAESATFCVRQVAISGTSDPGDHVEIVDAHTDTWLATFVAENTRWSGSINLSPGTHSIKARAVNPSDNTYSDFSAARTFSVDVGGKLSPVSVSSSAVSPVNRDGIRDNTTISANVLKPGRIFVFRIMFGSTLIRRSSGVIASVGKKSWTWDGKTSTGAWASNRTFQVVAEWTKAGCEADTKSASVRVDNIAPAISYVSDSPDVFHPVTDNYGDTTAIKFTTSEPANVLMKIFPKGSQTVVRQFSAVYTSPITKAFVWNGRRPNGSLVPPGVYEYQFWASDFIGNKRSPATGRGSITVTHKKLAWRTWSATRNGDEGRVFSTSTYEFCYLDFRHYDRSLSLWSQDCGDDYSPLDSVAALYNFNPPGATKYGSVTVSVYGKSDYGDALFGFLETWGSDSFTSLGTFGGSAYGWRSYPARAAAGHVRSGDRLLQVILGVVGQYSWRGEAEYDIDQVKVTVSYAVLA